MALQKIYSLIKESTKKFQRKLNSLSQNYTPTMRVASVEKDKMGEYVVTVQFLQKNAGFRIKPAELLGNNQLVDQFSPRDIRTLTYLGYLSVNSPEYKILARRLSEDNDQMLFAIHKKGEESYSFKTALEISTDPEILENLNQKDAHDIGFIAATEQQTADKKQKEKIEDDLNEKK